MRFSSPPETGGVARSAGVVLCDKSLHMLEGDRIRTTPSALRAATPPVSGGELELPCFEFWRQASNQSRSNLGMRRELEIFQIARLPMRAARDSEPRRADRPDIVPAIAV